MSRKAIIIGGLAAGLAVGGYGVADTYAGRGYRPEGAAKDELVRKAVEGQALLDSRAARLELARLDALVEAKQQQLYGCSRSWPEYAQVESELASLCGRRKVVDRDLAAEQAKMGASLRASEVLSAGMPAGVGDRFGAAQEERARFDAAMYPQAFSDVRFGPRPAHALGWAAGAAGTAVAVAGLVAVAGRRRKPETEGSDEDVFSKDLSDGQDAQDVDAAQAAVTKAEADRLQAEIDAAKAEAGRVRAERDSLRKLVDEAPKPSPEQEAELREALAKKEKALAERERDVAELKREVDDARSVMETRYEAIRRLTDENAKLKEAAEKAAKEASKAPAAPAPVDSDPDLADLVSGAAPAAAKEAEADGIVPPAEEAASPAAVIAATEIRPAGQTPADEKLASVVAAAVEDAMQRRTEAAEATQTTPEPMSLPAAEAPQAPAPAEAAAQPAAPAEMKPDSGAEIVSGLDRAAAKTQAWPQPASPAEPATLAIPSAPAEGDAASGAETTMAADAAQLPADAVSPQSAKAASPEKVGLFASIKAFFSFGKKKGAATAAKPAAPAAAQEAALPPLPPEPASEPVPEAAQPAAPAATITPEPADDDDSADFGNVRGSRSKMPVIDLSALEEQVDASGEANVAPAGKSGLAADPQAAQLGLPAGFIVAPRPAPAATPAATPVTQAPEAAPAARDEIDADVRKKAFGLFMEAAGLVPAGKHLRIPLRSKTLPAAGAQQAIGVLCVWKGQENGQDVVKISRTLDGKSLDYVLEDGIPAAAADVKTMIPPIAQWAVEEIEKSCKIPSPHLSGKALVGQFEMIKNAVTRG